MRRHVSVVLAAMVCAAAQALAQDIAQADPAGPGIDLVVVADRSGSMLWSGRPSADRLVRLALDLVARNAEATGVDHRFGVVSFGSAARADLAPMPLLNGGAARALRTLEGVAYTRSLGNTDILGALAEARRLLDALPANAARRRAILLITDGVAYVPGTPAVAYARELRRYAIESLRGVALEIFLLPPPSASRDERLLREMSHGQVHAFSGDAYMSLYRVVSGIVGTRTIEVSGRSGDTLVVPPYLDTIVFDVFRGHPPGEVAIFAPDALRPIDPEKAGEVRTGELLSTVVVRRPAPGRWTFRKTRANGRVKIFSQQFFPRGTLLEPAGAPVQQYDRIAVAYRLTDAGGAPLEELPGYPLSLAVTVITPNGQRRPLRVRRDSLRGPGRFRTIEKTECDAAGRYWTEVEVKTNDADEHAVSIFCDRWSGFRVSQALPARLAAAHDLHLVPPATLAVNRSGSGLFVVAAVAAVAIPLLMLGVRRSLRRS